jgi:lipooligosaccharide transport system ATP-binding protein
MIVVHAQNLQKQYGSLSVVKGIDLAIRRGECFGLLGPNGAGKTTILRMLLGLSPMSAGQLRVLDHAIPAQAEQMRRRAGVVPQQDNLDPDFTVRENLRVYGRYFGIARATLDERIPGLLRFAALEAKADARIATLSGGMRRRLVIARALINDPEILFLDEPTTGLDPQARHLIWQRLRGLRAAGKTLLLTTHYMDEAQRLCDRLVVMDEGRILDGGSPAELIARHIEPHVVEVSGEGVEEWLQNVGRVRARRAEMVGETAFCYCDDAHAVLDSLTVYPSLSYVHRPGNLEDVFLKLTGRDLRD